ncbi:hypothetical protein QPK87_37960 [Kamptonema cortianum]|nr:hypothetical protein [Geitlerinema splendidum]MDK3162294.1 hypothetical protein [Kamptonema cortianum]
MRLKTVTTVLLVLGTIMLLGIPVVLGQRPPNDAPREERANFALFFGSYVIIDMLIMVAVIIMAMIVMRRTAADLKEEARINMQAFVEGTLADHSKPSASDQDTSSGDAGQNDS